MRLLQINANGADDAALDLHPMVTVVQGLGEAGRDVILRLATSLPRGLDPGAVGLVEAHGVLLDLSSETLQLLDLDADVDVIVQREDIPGLAEIEVPDALAAGDAAPASRQEVEAFVDATPEGVYPELDATRRRRDDAREALEILDEARQKSRSAYDEALAALRAAEASLELARRSASRSTSTDDDRSGGGGAEQLRALEQRREEFEQEVADGRERLATIERSLAELSSIDTRPIVVLLDAIKDPEPVELVPSARGQELAEAYETTTREIAQLEKELRKEGLDSGSALGRLERARQELLEAERSLRKPELTPEDVAELEAAHEAVMEAEQKTTGLRKRSGSKALEAAREREQAILDRVGFPTWSAYIMGASLMSIDHDAEQRLERARAEMEDAEANWTRVVAVIDAHPEYRPLLNQLEDIELEANDLLGGSMPEDVVSALRELEVPEREVSTEELADALAYQLELVGLDLGPSPSVDLTVMAAEAFFEEAEAVQGRIGELETEQGQLLASVAAAEAELAALPRPEEVEVAVEESEPLELGGVDESRLGELEAELEAAREEEAEYREWVESREALVDAALQAETVAQSRLLRVAAELLAEHGATSTGGDLDLGSFASDVGPDLDLEAVEFFVLGRQAALRDVSFAGSVPLVIDDGLRGLDADQVRVVMDKLDDLADAVQIIYLSDDPAVAAWADEVGFARAAVVKAPSTFAGA